jgi:hypothetical protein
MNRHCELFRNIYDCILDISHEEMKVPSVHRMKREVRDSILGGCSFASYFRMLLYWHQLYSFNATYPDFTPHIILQSNVRISLVHPIEGNTRVQVEQRSYRSFKRIS